MKNNLVTNFKTKLNNQTFNFTKQLKHHLIVIATFIMLAAIVFALFNFNTSFALSGGYEAKVSFGTELTQQELISSKSKIKDVLSDLGISGYSIVDEATQTSANAFSIQIKHNGGVKDIEDLSEKLETKLTQALNPNDEYYGFEVSELMKATATISTDIIWFGVLGLVLVLLIISGYTFIRFDKVTALTMLISMIINALILLSLFAITRVEVGLAVFGSLATTFIYTYMLNAMSFVKIRSGFEKELYNHRTNASIVAEITKLSFYRNITITLLLILFGVSMMPITANSIYEFAFSIIYMSIIVLYTNVFVVFTFWASYYNKQNDKRLQKRLELKNKDNKEEELIVL